MQDFFFHQYFVISRPYTPNNGGKSYVWFDRKNISPFVSEHETLDETAKSLSQLIQTEVDGGIPLSRIIIGKKTYMYIIKLSIRIFIDTDGW